MFGSPETTPGGRAMKFYSAMRVRMKKKKLIEQDGEPIGIRAEMNVVKNKTAPPSRKAEYELFFETGFSKESDLLEAALEKGVCTKKGSWLFYNKTEKEQVQLGQGSLAVIKLLGDNPELFEEIWKKVEDSLLT